MMLAAGPAAAAALLLIAGGPAPAQGRETEFRAGLGADVLTRTIRWGDEKRESKLASSLMGLRLEMTFGSRLTLSLLGGLSFTDIDGLFFYHLPVSLEYRAGGVSGILLGAEVSARALTGGAFEIDGRARFLASAGTRTSWPLEGFAVDGQVLGQPNWTSAEIGPRVFYRGLKNASPYVFAAANWLGGDVRMEEALDTLKGEEKKNIKGAGLVRTGAGAVVTLGRRTSIWAEAGLVPHGGGASMDARIALLYSFGPGNPP